MKLSLENMAITGIGSLAGVLIGKTNTIKQFHNEKNINEVIGAISGNENKLCHSQLIKTKVKEG